MEHFAKVVNEQLPQYLQSLPIPKSVDDAKDLTSEELIALLPLFATLSVVLVALLHFATCKPAPAAPKVGMYMFNGYASVLFWRKTTSVGRGSHLH